MELETVVVVAGGHPSPGRAPSCRRRYVIAADAGIDRALALGPRIDRRDRRLRLGLGRPGSRPPRRRAHRSSGTRRPRTRPTSSSRSTPRSRSSPPGSSSSAAPAAGSTTCSARSCCSADDRYAGADGRCVSRRQPVCSDPRRAHADGHARRARLAAARARPGRGRHDERARVPARATRRSPPGTSRGVSNVFAAAEAQITVAHGCLVAVQPGPEREESL